MTKDNLEKIPYFVERGFVTDEQWQVASQKGYTYVSDKKVGIKLRRKRRTKDRGTSDLTQYLG